MLGGIGAEGKARNKTAMLRFGRKDWKAMPNSLILLPLIAILAGCNVVTVQKSPDNHAQKSAAATAPPAAPGESLTARLDQINRAGPPALPATPTVPPPAGVEPAPDASVIRAEVLLARARFSPGVADGQYGTNFKHAIAAYQSAHDLPGNGTMTTATWQALLSEPGAGPQAVRGYVITPADIAGPFAPDVGEDFVKLAAQPSGPLFANPVEALAERFHMSQDLLRALNPGVTFTTPGAHIIVVDDAPPDFVKGDVARIDVTKSDASARAYNDAGKLIAFYPATVGSTERPSPSGTHKVVGVAWNPDYTYDPTKLHWGPRAAGKLVIKPGPNNPVGMVWIDLNAPGYGVHGTPDPDKIGKTASHGCVRLTNWDAVALAHGVKPGVVVRFLGERGG
jgi:lipoprotein-anchoring transpeptidase ErfK/SrfK